MTPQKEGSRPMRFPATDIYALTDTRLSLGRSVPDMAREMMRAGVKILQYREKGKNAGVMLEECLALRAITHEAGCCFIVNDHVDIALLCDADGVHVGQEDLPPAAVRRLIGPDRIVGVSVCSMPEYEAAVAGGADYIGVGPVFPTETKEAAPLTPGFLSAVTAVSPIPVVAIGGINEKTMTEAVRQGARCCAIVSAITMAPDIPARVARLRALFAAAQTLT